MLGVSALWEQKKNVDGYASKPLNGQTELKKLLFIKHKGKQWREMMKYCSQNESPCSVKDRKVALYACFKHWI